MKSSKYYDFLRNFKYMPIIKEEKQDLIESDIKKELIKNTTITNIRGLKISEFDSTSILSTTRSSKLKKGISMTYFNHNNKEIKNPPKQNIYEKLS